LKLMKSDQKMKYNNLICLKKGMYYVECTWYNNNVNPVYSICPLVALCQVATQNFGPVWDVLSHGE
jgi:hypothetical protein